MQTMYLCNILRHCEVIMTYIFDVHTALIYIY